MEIVVSLTILTTVLIFLLLILLGLQLQITQLNREIGDIGSNVKRIATQLEKQGLQL
jgi:hypothetical protein